MRIKRLDIWHHRLLRSLRERATYSEWKSSFYLEGEAQDSKPFFVYILSRNKIILWAVYIVETMRKEKIEKVSSQRELFEG